MPFVLAVIGLIFIVTAIRGQQANLFGLVKGDFSGSGNFVYFIAAIMVVGAVGYIDRLKPISDGFLLLILLVLVIHNRGVFAQFQLALRGVDANTPQAQRAGE